MALLEVRGLTKYFGGLGALVDVDLEVESGQIVGLIGPNGAGKTTLFNVISGFYHPTRGKVIFKERNITGWKSHKVASHGMVRTFQATALFKHRSTFENVLIGHHLQQKVSLFGSLFNSPFAQREERAVRARTTEILEYMGLANIKDELAHNLPHGHQRALGVALAMACNPEIVLLDEPVTGMNPEEVITMMSLIQGIRDRGASILLVEHDMRAVMGICERIVVLNFGRKIAEGTPEEIRENRDVIEAYLGAEVGGDQDVA